LKKKLLEIGQKMFKHSVQRVSICILHWNFWENRSFFVCRLKWLFCKKKCLWEEKYLHSWNRKNLNSSRFFWLKNVSEVLKPLNKVNLAFCMFVKLKNRGGQRTFGRGLLYDSWSIFINFKNYWIWNCSIFLKS
jgi:hypothetical protein